MARYTAGVGPYLHRIYLDGVEVVDIVECDDVFGFAIQYVRDADGQFARDGNRLATRVLVGNVEVVHMEGRE